MDFRRLGKTDLKIAPIVFGGNVFGWTIDEKTSFSILDAFVDYGFNAIDTADVYSLWSPGNTGGESETIIGNWLKANPSKRDQVLIFTKVGADLGKPGEKGLSERWISEAVERSLKRLGIERIDLYFSHWPDAETPYEETLGAYEKLLKAGKIRAIGASNLDARQLGAALDVAKTHSLPRYDVLQPEYNLYDRASYDGPLRDLCLQNDIGVVTYYSLASGFLSGKYRSEADLTQSTRGKGIVKYLDARGASILSALDHVAQRHDATQAEIALAWLIAREGVTAPIASATRREHVASFAKAATLVLNPEDITELDTASAV
ncbi:aldo/keto reductase [Acetobacter indonesiensis]|uniref:aldo/keto reductase n=1 Tax=Acetobacter indonesiensis TaxID=104101 RepID=UPI0039E8ED37